MQKTIKSAIETHIQILVKVIKFSKKAIVLASSLVPKNKTIDIIVIKNIVNIRIKPLIKLFF